MKIISESPGWKFNIWEDGDAANIRGKSAMNATIVNRSLSQVIMARWIIFDTFIQVAREHSNEALPPHIQRDWLLFQILPKALLTPTERLKFVGILSWKRTLISSPLTGLWLQINFFSIK